MTFPEQIPLFDLHIDDAALRQKIESGFSTLLDKADYVGGENASQFAAEFSTYHGANLCVLLANVKEALEEALKKFQISHGTDVLLTPFASSDCANVILASGAKLRFVDIHPKSYTIDVNLLEKKTTPNTRAILATHLFGHSCDLDPLLHWGKEKNIRIIEDVTQGCGGEYKGRRLGSLGDAGCFSFYPTKNLGALGDGGALLMSEKGNQIHRFDSLQALVLRMKLKTLDQDNGRRRQIAEIYSKALLDNNYVTAPAIEPFAKHVFHLYVVETSSADTLQRRLQERGIETRKPRIPLHLQPAFASSEYRRGSLPVSEHVSERFLALPLYPAMKDEQVKRIVEALRLFHPEKPY